MDQQAQFLQQLLARFFDPSTPNEQKLEAESALQAFKARPDCWRLAIFVLQHATRGTARDPYLLWFAASVLEDTVRSGWWTVGEQEKQGLRDGLLGFLLRSAPGLPAFVANKMAIVCANIARLDWPHSQPNFMQVLASSLEDLATRPGGLLVLSISIEQFEAVAPEQPGRAVGQVLWSRGQQLQSLLEPVYPGVFSALTLALQQSAASQGSSSGESLSLSVLRALQRILGVSKGSHSMLLKVAACGAHSEQLLAALAGIATADRGVSGSDDGEAVAALDCLGLLADVALPLKTAEPFTASLLRHLQSLAEKAHSAVMDGSLDEEWWLSSVRLMCHFIRRHMPGMDSSPALLPQMDGLLQKVAGITFSVRTTSHVLVSCEVWRTVTTYLSELQEESYSGFDDGNSAEATWVAKAARLKDGLLGIVRTLLRASMCSTSSEEAPPISAAKLDRAEGSGAYLEEAAEGVKSITTTELEADIDLDEDTAEEPPASEMAVFVDQCESMVGQLIGVFPGDLVPMLVANFSPRLSDFESTAAQGDAQRLVAAALDLNTYLKLLARCACHLPQEGPAAAEVSQLVANLLQFARRWADLRTHTLGLTSSRNEIDDTGRLLFKVLAALAALWLPRQTESPEVASQMLDSYLAAAHSVLGTATENTGSAPQPLPNTLAAAFEMLAVLTKVFIARKEGQQVFYSEEQLGSFIKAAPALLLGPSGASGPLAGSLQAGRALYMALSDILLRACPTTAPEGTAARRAELILGPLVGIIQGAASGTTPAEVVARVSLVLSSIVSDLQTAPKAVRLAAYQGCIAQTIHASASVCRRCQEVMVSGNPNDSVLSPAAQMSESLNKLLAAIVRAFGPDLGAAGVQEILKVTLDIYSIEGKDGVDGWALVSNGGHGGALLGVLSQCATTRGCPAVLLTATLGFLFSLWDQIMEGFSSTSDESQSRGRGKGMKDFAADLGTLAALVLSRTTQIVQENWRSFIQDLDAQAGRTGAVAAALAGLAARQGVAGASAFRAQATVAAIHSVQSSAGQMMGPEAIFRMLDMAKLFFEGAAAQSEIAPSPSDVQLVLDALLDLEEEVELSKADTLRPAAHRLLRGLMLLLHAGRFSALEPDIISCIRLLAQANWTAYTDFLPAFVQELPEVLYAGGQKDLRGNTLLEALQTQGHDFSSAMARFMNDAKFFQIQHKVVV